MVSCDQVTLLAGEGIAGDRYATKLGSYSALKFSSREPGTREPGRQLTIISADGIESALERAGLPPTSASFREFRRNVVVRGITGEQLLMAQGSALRLGSGVVFVHRHCVPCMYNERLCGRQGQARECSHNRSGAARATLRSLLAPPHATRPRASLTRKVPPPLSPA